MCLPEFDTGVDLMLAFKEFGDAGSLIPGYSTSITGDDARQRARELNASAAQLPSLPDILEFKLRSPGASFDTSNSDHE
jgi:hypothetical protein